MSSTLDLLFLLFIFPVIVFSVRGHDNYPIRSGCGVSLLGHHTLAPLQAGRTVVNLIVQDVFTNYNVRLAIGSPARHYTLLLDTGTANFFVGRTYSPTSSSTNTTQIVVRDFKDDSALIGFEWIDTVNFGCVTLNQSIGGAYNSRKFPPDMGVLGIGPTNLTIGTLRNQMGQPIPTIIDNLVALNVTPSRTVGFSFSPWNKSSQVGEMTLGGIDQSHFVGPLIYASITKTSPSSKSVGINASIYYGNQLLLDNGAGVIDTGTTHLVLADDVFEAYIAAAGVKKGDPYSSIPTTGYDKLQPLVFVINGSYFALTPDGQRFPPSAARDHFLTKPGHFILPIKSSNVSSGHGNDFVLGMTWLRRFYHVYDPDNERIGVANTSYTNVIVN